MHTYARPYFQVLLLPLLFPRALMNDWYDSFGMQAFVVLQLFMNPRLFAPQICPLRHASVSAA